VFFSSSQVGKLNVVNFPVESHGCSLNVKDVFLHVVNIVRFGATFLDSIVKLPEETINLLLGLVRPSQSDALVSYRFSHVIEVFVKRYPANNIQEYYEPKGEREHQSCHLVPFLVSNKIFRNHDSYTFLLEEQEQ
jgi:hypothetical protein